MINKLIQKKLLWVTNLKYYFWYKKNYSTQKKYTHFRYQPLISIIVPVYNPPEIYLQKCFDSVLRQTYSNWELCLVDDCSPNPNIRQIISGYAAKDSRIKYSFHTKNGHISQTSNDAIALATGEFIALLDHDDEIAPHALSAVVKILNKSKDTDFIYSDEDKLSMSETHCDPSFKSDFAYDRLLSNNYICHLSVIRKSLVDQVSGFRLGYEGSQDYDLILRIIEKTNKIVHIPDILYHWRKIPNSTAAVYSVKSYANQASINTLVDHLKRIKTKGSVENGLKLGTFRVKYDIIGSPLVSVITSVPLPENFTSYQHIEICDSDVKAKGKYLLFINTNVNSFSDNWLESLLEHSQRPEIDIVFPKILFKNHTIANKNFYKLPDSINQPFPNLNAKDIINNFTDYSHEVYMTKNEKLHSKNSRIVYTPYSIITLPH